jgi:HEAT repeat protein
MDLEVVLLQLADEGRPARSVGLTGLSDLPRADLVHFGSAWRRLSLARRLELISAMVEQAETNIHLNFHAVLRECLNDADGQIRRLAIDGLWEDEKPSLIRRLVMLLTDDPVPEVRAAAATSLGRFVLLGALGEITETAASEAERSLRVVWGRAHESNEVRRRALESLSCVADSTVSDLIATAYDDDDDLMRQSAVFAMGRSADRRWSRLVLAELRSRSPAMRYEAAVSAGELGLSAAVQPLVQLMDDSDSNVREAAALALGKIGGREAKRALEEVLEGDDERLAQAAEDALDELAFNASGFELAPANDLEELGQSHRIVRRHRANGGGDADDEDFDAEDDDEDMIEIGEGEAFYWLDDEDVR